MVFALLSGGYPWPARPPQRGEAARVVPRLCRRRASGALQWQQQQQLLLPCRRCCCAWRECWLHSVSSASRPRRCRRRRRRRCCCCRPPPPSSVTALSALFSQSASTRRNSPTHTHTSVAHPPIDTHSLQLFCHAPSPRCRPLSLVFDIFHVHRCSSCRSGATATCACSCGRGSTYARPRRTWLATLTLCRWRCSWRVRTLYLIAALTLANCT